MTFAVGREKTYPAFNTLPTYRRLLSFASTADCFQVQVAVARRMAVV